MQNVPFQVVPKFVAGPGHQCAPSPNFPVRSLGRKGRTETVTVLGSSESPPLFRAQDAGELCPQLLALVPQPHSARWLALRRRAQEEAGWPDSEGPGPLVTVPTEALAGPRQLPASGHWAGAATGSGSGHSGRWHWHWQRRTGRGRCRPAGPGSPAATGEGLGVMPCQWAMPVPAWAGRGSH